MLAKLQADGATLRDHLLRIPEAMRDAEVRERLRPRPAPTRLSYLWDAFLTLCKVRRSGFAAMEPIGLDQLFYWQRVYGFPLHGWEIDLLLSVDAACRDEMGEKPKAKRG